jgi:hypothetical protein
MHYLYQKDKPALPPPQVVCLTNSQLFLSLRALRGQYLCNVLKLFLFIWTLVQTRDSSWSNL